MNLYSFFLCGFYFHCLVLSHFCLLHDSNEFLLSVFCFRSYYTFGFYVYIYGFRVNWWMVEGFRAEVHFKTSLIKKIEIQILIGDGHSAVQEILRVLCPGWDFVPCGHHLPLLPCAPLPTAPAKPPVYSWLPRVQTFIFYYKWDYSVFFFLCLAISITFPKFLHVVTNVGLLSF